MKLIVGLVLIAAAYAELSHVDYVPPAAEGLSLSNEYLAPAEDQTALSNDGYEYKTVRRFRNRNRRDVSELTSPQYLPPYEEEAYAPSNEYLAPAETQTVLADDGYRYKTVRRLRLRKRRDVSELTSGQYLPPHQEIAQHLEFYEPSNQYLSPVETQTVLADDGYRYKTVRRFRNRKRRDVSELSGAQYLPPYQEVSQSLDVQFPSTEYLAPTEQHTVIADDGYRYKTVKKYKIRRH